jgi:hypothetical protein
MRGLEPNVQRLVSTHLTPGEKRRLKVALSTTKNAAAQVIQHAFRQFKERQYVGQSKNLPYIHRGPWRYQGNRNVQARKLGIHQGNFVPTVANRWRTLASLPRGTFPFENRRSAYPMSLPAAYSEIGLTIPYVPLFVKFLHSKNNQQLKNYVTQRYPTYYKAAQAFGQIDRFLKRGFTYNKVKLLYPRLKKNWWLT